MVTGIIDHGRRLKLLRDRIERQTDRFVTISRGELRWLLDSCGVADRRLRSLGQRATPDEVLKLKRLTVLELIRSARLQRAVELRGQRKGGQP